MHLILASHLHLPLLLDCYKGEQERHKTTPTTPLPHNPVFCVVALGQWKCSMYPQCTAYQLGSVHPPGTMSTNWPIWDPQSEFSGVFWIVILLDILKIFDRNGVLGFPIKPRVLSGEDEVDMLCSCVTNVHQHHTISQSSEPNHFAADSGVEVNLDQAHQRQPRIASSQALELDRAGGLDESNVQSLLGTGHFPRLAFGQ